jgi:hypothetical protein
MSPAGVDTRTMRGNRGSGIVIVTTINGQTTTVPVGKPKPSRLRVARSYLLPLAVVASAAAAPWSIPVTVNTWEHVLRGSGQLLKLDAQELGFAAREMAREVGSTGELR